MEFQLIINTKRVVELTEHFLSLGQIHIVLALFNQLLIFILQISWICVPCAIYNDVQ